MTDHGELYVTFRDEFDTSTMTYKDALDLPNVYRDYDSACRDVEDSLNESYGDVDICGLSYGAGSALKDVDPIAFRCICSDEISEFYPDEFAPDES